MDKIELEKYVNLHTELRYNRWCKLYDVLNEKLQNIEFIDISLYFNENEREYNNKKKNTILYKLINNTTNYVDMFVSFDIIPAYLENTTIRISSKDFRNALMLLKEVLATGTDDECYIINNSNNNFVTFGIKEYYKIELKREK